MREVPSSPTTLASALSSVRLVAAPRPTDMLNIREAGGISWEHMSLFIMTNFSSSSFVFNPEISTCSHSQCGPPTSGKIVSTDQNSERRSRQLIVQIQFPSHSQCSAVNCVLIPTTYLPKVLFCSNPQSKMGNSDIICLSFYILGEEGLHCINSLLNCLELSRYNQRYFAS